LKIPLPIDLSFFSAPYIANTNTVINNFYYPSAAQPTYSYPQSFYPYIANPLPPPPMAPSGPPVSHQTPNYPPPVFYPSNMNLTLSSPTPKDQKKRKANQTNQEEKKQKT
jgi:hypothetical protein